MDNLHTKDLYRFYKNDPYKTILYDYPIQESKNLSMYSLLFG